MHQLELLIALGTIALFSWVLAGVVGITSASASFDPPASPTSWTTFALHIIGATSILLIVAILAFGWV